MRRRDPRAQDAMSTCYQIGCVDCEKTLWVGQSGHPQSYIYGTPKMIIDLGAFLFAHVGHRLVFNTSEALADFEDVEPRDDED
jgi:hypothetical protein